MSRSWVTPSFSQVESEALTMGNPYKNVVLGEGVDQFCVMCMLDDGLWYNADNQDADYSTGLIRMCLRDGDENGTVPALRQGVIPWEETLAGGFQRPGLTDDGERAWIGEYGSDDFNIYFDYDAPASSIARIIGYVTSFGLDFSPENDWIDLGAPGGCFVGETLVTLTDGGTKAIKDIKKGDIVLGCDEETLVNDAAEVVKTFSHLDRQTLRIRLSNGDHLRVTKNHLIYADGKFRMAAWLKVGMKLRNKAGEDVEITSSLIEPTNTPKVYDIRLGTLHAYYVNGVLAHNK